MKRRITRKSIVIGGVGILLFLGASTAQAGWLFVLAAGVLGLVVGSLFVRQGLEKLNLERWSPARSRVGDDVAVRLQVENRGKRTIALARVDDAHGAFPPLAALIDKLPSGGRATFESVRTALARGVYAGGEVTITSGSPFGLVRARRKIAIGDQMVVVPSWVELRSFPILEPASFPMESLHERARTGASEEYMGVREYRPGDPPRFVHWRSSARIGRLVVREFEERSTSRVAVILAGPDAGTPPDSAFEVLVSAAASVARYAIATGHPVDLIRPGDDAIEHVGDVDRWEVLEWLARALPLEGDLSEAVAAALARMARSGTVVLFAPSSRAAEIKDCVRAVQGAGSRGIVVAADLHTWDASMPADPGAAADLAERVTTRFLRQKEDLASCLSV